MSYNDQQMRSVLARIRELAGDALHDHGESAHEHHGPNGNGRHPVEFCAPKVLPRRLWAAAAETARAINPVNAPSVFGPAAAFALDSRIEEPLRIAVLTSKYWGPQPRRLTVSFMEATSTELRNLIISHLNAWNRTGGISFVHTSGTGDVRISREPGGYYSYLGTDILHVPTNRQTMNLEGFTVNTPEKEYLRVVRHEAGHTLGFPHEHMRRDLVERIDPEKAYRWFLLQFGWNRAMVDAQVLTPLDEASIMSTPADQTSIMCYQLPGQITRDGKPITGGPDINESDAAFVARIYPKTGSAPVHAGHEHNSDGDWSESEDVLVNANRWAN